MASPSRAAVALVLLATAAIVVACHRAARANPVHQPSARNWILPAAADDDEPFCIQSNGFADQYPSRCTTVADVRHYVRAQRSANE